MTWDNIAQLKTQWNVAKEAPDKFALEIILCNVFLILSGQYWTRQISMQCCPRGSRQHCLSKGPAHCCLITLKKILHSWKLNAMLSERLQTTLFRKHLVQNCLNTLGKTLHRSKPYAMLPKKLQTTFHKKHSCAKLSEYSCNNIAQVNVLCNVVRKAPDNIA